MLVFELGRNHALHPSQPLQHDVLIILQGSLDPASEGGECLVERLVAPNKEFAGGSLNFGSRGSPWHRRGGAALFEGRLA